MSINIHPPRVPSQYEQKVCLNYLKTILYIAHANVEEVSKKISPVTRSKHVFKANKKMTSLKTSGKTESQFASIFQPRKSNHISTTHPQKSEEMQNLCIQRIQTRTIYRSKGFNSHKTRKNRETTGLDEDQNIQTQKKYKPQKKEESQELGELINLYVLHGEIEDGTSREDYTPRDKPSLEEGAFWKKHTLRQVKSRPRKLHDSKNSKKHEKAFKNRTKEMNRLRDEKKSLAYL